MGRDGLIPEINVAAVAERSVVKGVPITEAAVVTAFAEAAAFEAVVASSAVAVDARLLRLFVRY